MLKVLDQIYVLPPFSIGLSGENEAFRRAVASRRAGSRDVNAHESLADMSPANGECSRQCPPGIFDVEDGVLVSPRQPAG
jgi:hypothetical protein